jgi:hypothetical protein
MNNENEKHDFDNTDDGNDDDDTPLTKY